ncbi:MAG: GIY-YIG nuclease family protein [Methanofollis sp.]|uniref:GIY-YIG nuclease family protein n=1 Tax=Methanofollis sp. TaxID=2052835 RepID=UPI00261BED93|nr:GIY-YIG nuclease family protein [Methanofollis sp.]MDD4256163.1 GIY-YIG nuclease family protein [Methanofollis sp.]
MKGVYCLVLHTPACEVEVGSLGTVRFRAGYHIYVGSARGPGGLEARVGRHFRLAATREGRPHWHIDRLLLTPGITLAGAVLGATAEDFECRIATAIGGEAVPGFGCTDCSCPSHLFFRPEEPFSGIGEAFRRTGLVPQIRKSNMGEVHLSV